MSNYIRRYPTVVLLVIAGFQLLPSRIDAQPHITVAKPVQVSKSRADMRHHEVLLSASPTDPNLLLGGSMTEPGTIAYMSRDGGETWQQAIEPPTTTSTADPATAIDKDGRLYFAILRRAGPGVSLVGATMDVYTSVDGKTWGTPKVVPMIDREFITIDGTGGKYDGRVYINGTGSLHGIDSTESASTLSYYISTDQAKNFGTNIFGAAFGNGLIRRMGNSAILSDGTLVTVFGTLPERTQQPTALSANGWLKAAISTDGGASMASMVNVSRWWMPTTVGNGAGQPVVAADTHATAFKDRLYVVWGDVRSGRIEVMLSYSADKGKTWSLPRRVNDDKPTLSWDDATDDRGLSILPAVAVNKDGVVGVSWYRRGIAPNEGYRSVRFAASLDGGETFTPSLEVNSYPDLTRSTTPALRVFSGNILSVFAGLPVTPALGDTAGLAADAGGAFHPFWIDNPTGVDQIWSARVTVDGRVYKNGAPDVEDLDDITSKLEISMSDQTYDRSTGIVSLTARVKNKSKQTIRGPLKLRLIELFSDLGFATVMNANNGAPKEGAVWDLSSLLIDNSLAPDQVSGPKVLKFQITDVNMKLLRVSDLGGGRTGLVRTTLRALGKTGS